MKKWAWLTLTIVLLAGFASADTLQLVSTPTGVNGPYELSLNGSAATPMICYSENNHITIGETWNVQAYTIATIGSIPAGPFSGTTYQYDLIGYLSTELFANPGNADLQNAIWAVLGLGGAQNADYTAAVNFLAANKNYTTNDTFYIPVGNYAAGDVPQPMVGTPEPSSLLLLGSGLLTAIGMRRKLRA